MVKTNPEGAKNDSIEKGAEGNLIRFLLAVLATAAFVLIAIFFF